MEIRPSEMSAVEELGLHPVYAVREYGKSLKAEVG